MFKTHSGERFYLENFNSTSGFFQVLWQMALIISGQFRKGEKSIGETFGNFPQSGVEQAQPLRGLRPLDMGCSP